MESRLADSLLAFAILCLVTGVAVGLYMGMAEDFSLVGLHAHANLAGWASMAIMAIIYRLWPHLAASRLALLHVLCHVAGMPLMLAGLFGLARGMAFGEMLTGAGSMLVAVGIVFFALNALPRLSGLRSLPTAPDKA